MKRRLSVITGAAFSVFPDNRRIIIPECSRKARVKQFRLKNCNGSHVAAFKINI
ncbi:MAG TPA: hypothetical protein VFY40_12765 [Blastocatellia bacterium]|nr:hypothetical protein [Blastocatellia bacterium]